MTTNTPRSKRTYFITGTDTDAGKTVATVALLQAAANQGYQTIGLKPVAAGAEPTDDGLRNDDALKIQAAMTQALPYSQVNPVIFEEPIAPHIAAQRAGKRPTVSRLEGLCRGAMMQPYDLGFIEGAGGWRVPLNDRELLSDLPVALGLPVIMVIGLRLGCLNHSLLTVEAIQRDGLTLAGWIGCCVEPEMPLRDENLETLGARINAPCLGVIPHLDNLAEAAGYIDIDRL